MRGAPRRSRPRSGARAVFALGVGVWGASCGHRRSREWRAVTPVRGLVSSRARPCGRTRQRALRGRHGRKEGRHRTRGYGRARGGCMPCAPRACVHLATLSPGASRRRHSAKRASVAASRPVAPPPDARRRHSPPPTTSLHLSPRPGAHSAQRALGRTVRRTPSDAGTFDRAPRGTTARSGWSAGRR